MRTADTPWEEDIPQLYHLGIIQKNERGDYSGEKDQTTVLLPRNTGITGVWESTTGTVPGHPSSRMARKAFSSSSQHQTTWKLFIFHSALSKTCSGLLHGPLQMGLLGRHVHKPLVLVGIFCFGWRLRHLGVVRLVLSDFSAAWGLFVLQGDESSFKGVFSHTKPSKSAPMIHPARWRQWAWATWMHRTHSMYEADVEVDWISCLMSP